ncbi:MAG: hypothetical protein WBF52_12995 [Geitlerinemataceae cyanobacterium]
MTNTRACNDEGQIIVPFGKGEALPRLCENFADDTIAPLSFDLGHGYVLSNLTPIEQQKHP